MSRGCHGCLVLLLSQEDLSSFGHAICCESFVGADLYAQLLSIPEDAAL
jgi:hypothetical protein